MKYCSLLLVLALSLFSRIDAMYAHDEIGLEIVNETSRIVSAFDQQEHYHDLFPKQFKNSHSFTLSADHHRSYKICAPEITYTLLFHKRHRDKPIVQLCRREIKEHYRGPEPENTAIDNVEVNNACTVIATITAQGQVRLYRK